jgi:Na+-translocating ferredoxin:NAD+ oxidoreductase subunit G
MKNILIPGIKLLLITMVSALFLALINSVTAPIIIENKKIALENALDSVTTEGTAGQFHELKDKVVTGYYPISVGEKLNGYVLRLIGEGYGGDLVILASYDLDGTVDKVKLLENSETPGLGKEAEKDPYMKVFEGTGGATPVPVWKSELPQSKVSAISGASVTWYGLAQAVRAGSEMIINGLEAAK